MQASIVLSTFPIIFKSHHENLFDADSNLRESGGCEACQSESVHALAQWQASKGSEPLSQIIEVSEIGSF